MMHNPAVHIDAAIRGPLLTLAVATVASACRAAPRLAKAKPATWLGSKGLSLSCDAAEQGLLGVGDTLRFPVTRVVRAASDSLWRCVPFGSTKVTWSLSDSTTAHVDS